jgi:hypothetical protein
MDPDTTEDCLFLDVVIPKRVWEGCNKKAPVVIWCVLNPSSSQTNQMKDIWWRLYRRLEG